MPSHLFLTVAAETTVTVHEWVVLTGYVDPSVGDLSSHPLAVTQDCNKWHHWFTEPSICLFVDQGLILPFLTALGSLALWFLLTTNALVLTTGNLICSGETRRNRSTERHFLHFLCRLVNSFSTNKTGEFCMPCLQLYMKRSDPWWEGYPRARVTLGKTTLNSFLCKLQRPVYVRSRKVVSGGRVTLGVGFLALQGRLTLGSEKTIFHVNTLSFFVSPGRDNLRYNEYAQTLLFSKWRQTSNHNQSCLRNLKIKGGLSLLRWLNP